MQGIAGGLQGHCRVLQGAIGALFGLFGRVWEVSGAILEAIDQKKAGNLLVPPRRGPKSRLLEPSWAAPGALLGALGPVLGLSGDCLGALLGHLWAILRPQEPIESENARRPNILIFLWFFKDFGLWGASLGSSVASWGRPGAILEPLVGMLGAILSHRGPS